MGAVVALSRATIATGRRLGHPPGRGGGRRYLTTAGTSDYPAESDYVADDYAPDWSPDGTRILFSRTVWFCGSCDQNELFSVGAGGGDTQWVTTDSSFEANRSVWSP